MHIRKSTRRQRGKVYVHHQLVQSYRRPDGMPAHKVILSLKDWSPEAIENLDRALKASRKGQTVLLPSEVSQFIPPRKVRANLQYLDVATVHHLWDQWKLGPLLDELLPSSRADVPTSSVIEALVIQRCVAPASKLKAQRWYPRTALPELQGVAPGKVHNTRIHRALDQLEVIELPLQERLARRVHAGGPFTAVYIDATDTWFEGQGPDMAYPRITKEGLLRRRIGIVLLCDARGYPLRWATVPGNHHEAHTMMDMLRQVAALPWMDQVPLVADRAMGRGVTIGALCAHHVRFVTAVPAPEIPAYSPDVPLGAFDGLDGDGQDRDDREARRTLHEAAVDLGFERVADDRYVLDLGVLERADGPGAVDQDTVAQTPAAPTRSVAALGLAHRLQHELDTGAAASIEELASRYDCSELTIRHWLSLLNLTEEVQRQILGGAADRIQQGTLRRIAAADPDEQLATLEAAAEVAQDRPVLWPTRQLEKVTHRPTIRVRGVVLFNPLRFLEQRQTARKQLESLHAFVDHLNRKLRSPRSRRNRDSVLATVGGELKHRGWTDLFAIQVDEVPHEGRTVWQVTLRRDEEAWHRRHRADGLLLIVAHPDVLGSAADLVALYFAKDMVEKDFQTIKSVLELRPLRHRTDPKVRAHVTLCMLALLLERSMEQQLKDDGIAMTADAALDELSSCHLNLYADTPSPTYSVTELTPDQRRILAAMQMEDLAEDGAVAQVITPR